MILKRLHSWFFKGPDLFYIMKKFDLDHPTFKGFTFRDNAENNRLVLTTEGKPGEEQFIRVPRNLMSFPLDFVVHLLSHEMVHIEQRARSSWQESKAAREFEAYYIGLFPTNLKLPPCPPSLINQFKKNLKKYWNQMTLDEQKKHRSMYSKAFPED